ncbi:MAG: NAD(P)H-dependent oxidoreductase subunit E [Bacteroidales bacterium]|nr:NAD(P)H-dependent oxidoreductase subunit E [Bacteroidales bacterium]MCF8390041.1 NAD(P)H-dependent oxidoreductase subunit E [Bacteroidales bacterium]
MRVDLKEIEQIATSIGRDKKFVIPILQAIQKKYNFLPEEALEKVCEITDIRPAQIISVASFYSQFRFEPAGKHIIKVCMGTACHVKGAEQVYDAFKREFKLEGSQDTDASGNYTIEKVNCLGCCTLAPVVQIDNITYGHVSSGTINEVLSDFETQKDGSEKKQFRKPSGEVIKGEIRIGLGSCCVASGSDEIRDAVKNTIDTKSLDVNLKHVGCVGMCHQVPLVEVVPENGEAILYSKVKAVDIDQIIQKHFQPKSKLKRLSNKIVNAIENVVDDSRWGGIEKYSIDVREKHVSSFLDRQKPIATEFRGIINPIDIKEYKSRFGFKALEKCLKKNDPEWLINEVKESGIRGRGGAGFPTSVKWSLVAAEKSEKKYVICNGDEGDPGAFMDRMLLESYPYRIIEGMIIGAFAVGSDEGIFYIRAEYPLAVTRIQQAIKICYEEGYLGENILGSGFTFHASVYQGAGAFVCGEETALIASIEGKRGFPHIRPPYPAKEGLWGKPTLVNNTETLAQIAYILLHNAKAFNSIGTEKSRGTKVFALAGKVARGGLIEVPMGMTIREVVEEIGGGVANNRTFKAVQVGGPSGGCIPASMSDTRIDFESLAEVGAMMGSGGMVVLDDKDCMVDIAKYFLSFTQNESCGKCTFCRVGTKRMLEILEKITRGKGVSKDLEELESLAEWTKKGSLCGLGKTAPNPVLSTLKFFREEYEAHINGICPSGKCQDMIQYHITDDCIGCTKCAQECPVDAIPFAPHEKHLIDTELCIKCDSCRQVCPIDAVITK